MFKRKTVSDIFSDFTKIRTRLNDLVAAGNKIISANNAVIKRAVDDNKAIVVENKLALGGIDNINTIIPKQLTK